MDHFFVVLPSNGSSEIYSDNTLAHFTNQLKHPIQLEGDYEVAVVEIIYPYPHHSILPNTEYVQIYTATDAKPDENSVSYVEEGGKSLYDRFLRAKIVDPGVYNNPLQLYDQLRFVFDTSSMKLEYNFRLNRFGIWGFANGISKVVISNKLAQSLGFDIEPDRNLILRKDCYAEKPPGLVGELGPMFVYCNIIENQIIGSKTVPLLRVVCPDEHNHGNSTVSEKYIKPYYLKVNKKYVDLIQISIQTEEGTPYPFKSGRPLVLKLHFQRVK